MKRLVIEVIFTVPLSSKEEEQKDGIYFGYDASVLEEYKNEDYKKRLKDNKDTL